MPTGKWERWMNYIDTATNKRKCGCCDGVIQPNEKHFKSGRCGWYPNTTNICYKCMKKIMNGLKPKGRKNDK